MVFQSPQPQECYFYQGRWSEETVNLFVRLLMDDVRQGQWAVGGENKWEIQSALDFINVMLEMELTWEDAVGLVNLLRTRYSTFKHVLGTDGVRWDRHYNHVHADQAVWDELFKWNEFTRAYYHKGDALHGSLRKLFEKQENLPNNTIVISDSDGPTARVPNNVDLPIIILESDGEQELTSPVVAIRKPLRKKLFAEELTTPTILFASAESETQPNDEQGVGCTRKGVHCPQSTLLKNVIKKETSSCASSSPLRLTYSPLGKQ